jgi:HEAT repeats
MATFDELVQKLRQRDGFYFDRKDAVAQLARMDDPRVVTLLVEALTDPEPSVRREAVEQIAGRNAVEATEPLIRTLQSDADGDVRREAVEALGKLGGENSHAAVEAALGDRALGVRWAAEAALKQLHQRSAASDCPTKPMAAEASALLLPEARATASREVSTQAVSSASEEAAPVLAPEVLSTMSPAETPRLVLLGQVVGALQGPLLGLISTLQAIVQQSMSTQQVMAAQKETDRAYPASVARVSTLPTAPVPSEHGLPAQLELPPLTTLDGGPGGASQFGSFLTRPLPPGVVATVLILVVLLIAVLWSYYMK